MKKFFIAVGFLAAIFLQTQNLNAHQNLQIDSPYGVPLFYLDIYDMWEHYDYNSDPDLSGDSTWTLRKKHLQMLQIGMQYWALLLNNRPPDPVDPPAAIYPARIMVVTYDVENANAISSHDPTGEGMTNLGSAVVNNSAVSPSTAVAYARIQIGKFGPPIEPHTINAGPMTIVSHDENNNGLSAVIVHETGHAMGIMTYLGNDTAGNIIFMPYNYAPSPEPTPTPLAAAPNAIDTALTLYDRYLADSWGKPAKAGTMPIIESNTDSSQEFVIMKNGFAYFQGPEVLEVLQGGIPAGSWNAVVQKENNPNNVWGIPINGFEWGIPELSHPELRNSMMSHQNYRNWNVFMEAELALLNDIGIPVDRANFYGYSVYYDNQNKTIDNNFYARNREGTAYLDGIASTTSWAIGVHIYGSTNTLNITGQLLADGFASMGVKVDGWGNNITIAAGAKITANGFMGVGLSANYGRSNTIVHRGIINADGEGGIGVSFDFGDNLLGNAVAYRGSYINTNYNQKSVLPYELAGPIVENFNIIGGTITGRYAAIYISKNAHVKSINIMGKSTISGDIISAWNPNDANIDSKFRGSPALQTTLSFGLLPDAAGEAAQEGEPTFGLLADAAGNAAQAGDPNFYLDYDGNIIGRESLNFILAGGSFTYTGAGKMDVQSFSMGPNTKIKLNLYGDSAYAVYANKASFSKDSQIEVVLAPTYKAYYNSSGYNAFSIFANDMSGSQNVDVKMDYDNSVPLYIGLEKYSDYQLVVVRGENGEPARFMIVGGKVEVNQDLIVDTQNAGAPFLISAQNLSGDIVGARFSKAERGAFWISPQYAFTQNNNSANEAYSINTIGAAVGVDTFIVRNVFLLGAALNLASPKFKLNNSTTDSSLVKGIGYAQIRTFVDVGVFGAVGSLTNTADRVQNNISYRSQYSVNQMEFGAEISKTFQAANLGIKPFVSYEIMQLEIPDYDEGNQKEEALYYFNEDTETHFVKVGLEQTLLVSRIFNINFGIFYRGQFGDMASNTKVSLALDPLKEQRVAVETAQINQNSFGLDIGFALSITRGQAVNIGYLFLTDVEQVTHKFGLDYIIKF
ncbi:MAG: autotransporter outer membrane beta-barrel domain-containing protein [Elusimicrobiota bacterium]|jgi:hypothetical protein|nr:autotransporter outer membrane beta-barrel domain-containing protein [Elusimicrobiota bacterium]